MRKLLTLKTHKNQVFEFIAQLGMDPAEFLWDEVEGLVDSDDIVSRLVHSPTGFYFQFDFHQGQHYAARSPGSDTPVDTQNTGAWKQQLSSVNEWVNRVKEEYLAPDLWGTLASSEYVLTQAAIDQSDNSPFGSEEVGELRAALREISEFAQTTLDLTGDQTETMEKRFTYLDEAVARMGRLDWFHTFVGVFVTVVMSLALAPEQSKELWQFSMQVLRTVGRIRGLLP